MGTALVALAAVFVVALEHEGRLALVVLGHGGGADTRTPPYAAVLEHEGRLALVVLGHGAGAGTRTPPYLNTRGGLCWWYLGAIAQTTQQESIREQNRAHFPRAPGLATRHTPGP